MIKWIYKMAMGILLRDLKRAINVKWDLHELHVKALPHAAIKQGIFLRFYAFRSIADHRRSSQVSPQKSQQCGMSASHDGIFLYSPAMPIAAMVIRNI